MAAGLVSPWLLLLLSCAAKAHASIRIVQLTDVHYDPLFFDGAHANALCHHPASLDTARVLHDRHYGLAGSACDSPLSLVEATVAALHDMTSNQNDGIAAILWTGDTPRHDRDSDYPRTSSETQSQIATVTKMLQTIGEESSVAKSTKHHDKKPREKTGYTRKPVIIPSIGNWDIWPVNMLPGGPNAQLRLLHDLWQPLWSNLPESASISSAFLRGGYFALTIPNTTVTVLSLNTHYWSTGNERTGDCSDSLHSNPSTSPGDDHLEWLDQTLTNATATGHSIIIIGHIPPVSHQNSPLYTPICLDRFSNIVGSHASVILSQYYGHLNRDTPLVVMEHTGNSIESITHNQKNDVTHADGKNDSNQAKSHHEKRGKHKSSKHKSSKHKSSKHHVAENMQVDQNKRYHIEAITSTSIKSIHLDNHRIVGTLFIGPSIVPTFNPGFREIIIGNADLPSTRSPHVSKDATDAHSVNHTNAISRHHSTPTTILEHIQHYAPLSVINKAYETNPANATFAFSPACSTRTKFGMADLGAKNIQALLQNLQSEALLQDNSSYHESTHLDKEKRNPHHHHATRSKQKSLLKLLSKCSRINYKASKHVKSPATTSLPSPSHSLPPTTVILYASALIGILSISAVVLGIITRKYVVSVSQNGYHLIDQ